MASRFLVVGCGSMGRRRIRHAIARPNARVAVHDRRADRMDEVCRQHQLSRLASVGEFAAFAPDALFICVPPADHESYIDWAIGRGVHFMVEEPVSHRLDALDRMLAGVREKRIVAHVSNSHAFAADVQMLAAIVRSGEFGRALTGIVERGEWLPDWHSYEPYTDYYPSRRAMGGGLDAICDYAWLSALFGQPRAAKSLASKRSTLDIDTPDVVQIAVDFADGPQVMLHEDMLQRPYAGQWKFVFEKVVVAYQAPEPAIRIWRHEARAWESRTLSDGRERHGSMQGKTGFNFVEPMYEADSEAFFDRLARGDTASASLEDAIANLRTIHPLCYG